MNKNLLKKILIIVGTLVILGVYITFVIDTASVIDGFIMMIIGIGIDLDEIESIITIIGLILLLIGIFIKGDKEKEIINKNDNYEIKPKTKKKYIIMLILGLLPFIVFLGSAIFYVINGISFFYNTVYGLEALEVVTAVYFIFLWPIYIIGLILIVKSIQKLKQFKNREDK